MTDRLRTLLHEAAKDARNYSQAELGPAAAQLDQARRRSMILPLAVAASVVLITVAALVAVPLLTESDESGPAPASSTSYPRDIEPPPNASPLPSGTVGAAAFIYAPCYATCDPFLVMPPGQYELPRSPRGEATASYALSPNGRWLADCGTQGCRLRDLEHGDRRDIADKGRGASEIWAWSPNSSWLLLVRHVDGAIEHLQTINLDTGERHRVVDTAVSPLVIDDEGALIYATFDPAGPRLVTADIAAGNIEPGTAVTVRARSQLREGERLSARTLSLLLVPDSNLAVVGVGVKSPGEAVHRPTGLLVVDRTDGHVVRRLPIPRSDWSDGSGVWRIESAQPGASLLIHAGPQDTEIVRLDHTTGKRTVLSTLPRESLLVLRDSNRA